MKKEDALNMLGLKVKDRVTGRRGVVTSICFDLYGCVQGLLHPGLDKDGNQMDTAWYDIARLEVEDRVQVMEQPVFVMQSADIGDKGPAEKPRCIAP